MRETRYRNFVAIGYPESLVENWQEVLQDSHIQICVSPLHDSDENPGGEIKKEHFHILLMYDAPHTYKQAQDFFDSIKATKCEIVNSLRGQARYLCHLDNPEKHRYSEEDVLCLNGVDYRTLIELPTDNRKAVKEMINFIKENNVMAFSDLVEYAEVNNESWFVSLLEHNTIFIKEYMKSRAWKVKEASFLAQHEEMKKIEEEVNNSWTIFKQTQIDELGHMSTQRVETYDNRKDAEDACRDYSQNNENADVSYFVDKESM